MQKIKAKIELLAKVDVPVLISGESGSGRETVARLIHQLSSRAKHKFAKVNCAALDADSLEHELFASTSNSAAPGRAGALAGCGGTILLQEITHVQARIQAQLLEILQEHPVGTGNKSGLDVRILASTDSAEFGGFRERLREDFYDRLSAFTIHIPPLRERREELRILAAHFMDRMAKRYRMTPRPFSDALLDQIEEHTWPGNLRELEIFVQRYLVMGDEQAARAEEKSKALATTALSTLPLDGKAYENANGLKSLVRSIKGETEKTAIANVLEKTQWNRKEAARFLGISYRSLLYKIEQYELSPHASGSGFKMSEKGTKVRAHI
jgi:DNA-binding NtrC family response regulator